MNQNEKALDALKAVADGSQLALDNPKWRLDEATCNLVRDALESQPVAGQVSGEEVEADLKNILNVLGLNFDGPNRNENLRRLRKYAERALAVFRTAQQPKAPAVEVTFDDINGAYNEGTTSVMLKYDPHEVPLEALGIAHQAGIQRILALLTKGAH